MSDNHKLKTLSVRPDPDERAEATAVLDQHGWEMEPFLRACLRLVRADPEQTLAALAPHRPPPRRMGRPPSS